MIVGRCVGLLLQMLGGLLQGLQLFFRLQATFRQLRKLCFAGHLLGVGLCGAALALLLLLGGGLLLLLRCSPAGGLCCGGFLAAATLFQQAGIVTTTAGKAGFITAMYMLLVPVLGFVLFRRKNGALVRAAVALGVAGMYLLCMTERFTLARGDALVCVCALLFSGHILCCDHFARRGDPIRISAVQFCAAALVSLAAAALCEQPSWAKICSAAVPILYCGILSGGVGYTLQMTAQRFTDPTIASLLMSLESVFAVLAGALLLGERMSAREGFGCALMFAAIILVQLPQKGREQNT